MCAGIGCFPNAHFSSDDVRDDQPVMLFIQNSFYAFVKKNMMCSLDIICQPYLPLTYSLFWMVIFTLQGHMLIYTPLLN